MSDLFPLYPSPSHARPQVVCRFSVPPPTGVFSFSSSARLARPLGVKKAKIPGLESKKNRRKKAAEISEPVDPDESKWRLKMGDFSFLGSPDFQGAVESRGLAMADGRNSSHCVLVYQHRQFTLVPCEFLSFRPVSSDSSLSLEEAEKLMRLKLKRFERRQAKFHKLNEGAEEMSAPRLKTTQIRTVDSSDAGGIFELGGESLAEFSERGGSQRIKKIQEKREKKIDFEENFDDDEGEAGEEENIEGSEEEETIEDSQASKRTKNLIKRIETDENGEVRRKKKNRENNSDSEDSGEESESAEDSELSQPQDAKEAAKEKAKKAGAQQASGWESEEGGDSSSEGSSDFSDSDLSLSEEDDEEAAPSGNSKKRARASDDSEEQKKKPKEQKKENNENVELLESDILAEFGDSQALSAADLSRRLLEKGKLTEKTKPALLVLVKKLCQSQGRQLILRTNKANQQMEID